MADPRLEDLLESHRRFAPEIADDRLIQIIKERRQQLGSRGPFSPEWKEEILKIYVDEATEGRGMYVGNPRKKKATKKKSKRKTKKKATKKKKPRTLKGRVRTVAKKGERAAKRGAKDAKKFAKTKEGYTTGGGFAGALVAGPIGALIGGVGGSALHEENPSTPPSRRRMVSGRVPSGMSKTVYKREANKHALEAEGFLRAWEARQDPDDLIQALRSTTLAANYYRHAGIPGSATSFGADSAEGQYDSIRAQIMEILA
jgi:predicted RNA-binding protein YlxR (DUF448 family)